MNCEIQNNDPSLHCLHSVMIQGINVGGRKKDYIGNG